MSDLDDPRESDEFYQIEIGERTVDRRSKHREECPTCGRTTTWYYLGSVGDIVGWICGRCTSEIEETRDGEIEVVDR